ncbi:MAG: hypothetical protein LWW90_03215 [Candidatus Desulfofervidus auxilii]|nr:hypothetical protein [Candidatus Desulfofervidus auxilii]
MKIESKLNKIEKTLAKLTKSEKPKETVWIKIVPGDKKCPLKPSQKCPMKPDRNAGIVVTSCRNCPL